METGSEMARNLGEGEGGEESLARVLGGIENHSDTGSIHLEASNMGNFREATKAATRAKSSLRLRYEAEALVIKRKLGDLEAIRSRLGLSQRKMSQLLFVDPSAWTRWTRDGEQPPPHVYRMLQWYLALQDKYPALDVNFWLSTVARVEDSAQGLVRDHRFKELNAEVEDLTLEIQRLTRRVESQAQESQALESRLLESNSRQAANHSHDLDGGMGANANSTFDVRPPSWLVLSAILASFASGLAVAIWLF